MASYRTLDSGNIQAIVRRKGHKSLYGSFPTRAEAEGWAAIAARNPSLAAEITSGIAAQEHVTTVATRSGPLDICVPTLAAWIDAFIERGEYKDRSMTSRLRRWQHLLPGFMVTDVEPEDVDDALYDMQDQGLSGSTLCRYKSNLSSVYTAFIRDRRYKRLRLVNPVLNDLVMRPGENPPKNRFLDPEEQRTLLRYARESHWERMPLLVLMALTTGARRNELLGLRWGDIDFARSAALVRSTKNGAPRYLPLLPAVLSELMRWRGAPVDRVFPAQNDPQEAFAIQYHWQALRHACGLDGLRFHDLRHTTASNAVASGHTLFEVGVLLGHTSPQSTARYAHLDTVHTLKVAGDAWRNAQGGAPPRPVGPAPVIPLHNSG